MAREPRQFLAERANWQRPGLERASKAEVVFDIAMSEYLSDEPSIICKKKPKALKGIYGVSDSGQPHGIVPDFELHDTKTGKSIFVEVKRQRAAGNAHERACKYFTPGIMSSARGIGNQPKDIFPFWLIFTNGIANDHRYVSEISHWFLGYERHLLLWSDWKDLEVLLTHFEEHIRSLLE